MYKSKQKNHYEWWERWGKLHQPLRTKNGRTVKRVLLVEQIQESFYQSHVNCRCAHIQFLEDAKESNKDQIKEIIKDHIEGPFKMSNPHNVKRKGYPQYCPTPSDVIPVSQKHSEMVREFLEAYPTWSDLNENQIRLSETFELWELAKRWSDFKYATKESFKQYFNGFWDALTRPFRRRE